MPCDGNPPYLPPFTLHPQLQFRPVMTGASLRLLLVIPQGFSRSSLWWVSPFSSRTADIRWQGSVSYLLNTQDLSRWIKEIEHAPENQKCLMFLSELHSQTISVALKDKVSFLNAKCIFRGGQLWWPLRQREIWSSLIKYKVESWLRSAAREGRMAATVVEMWEQKSPRKIWPLKSNSSTSIDYYYKWIHRPPEALPAPKQGEYPTGSPSTTPMIRLSLTLNFFGQLNSYSQGILAQRSLNMTSSWQILRKMSWKLHSGLHLTFAWICILLLWRYSIKKSISNLQQCPVLSQAFWR